MPRSSQRSLSPRELSREAKRQRSLVRSISAYPDQMEVVVEGKTPDGRYRVRRDHWGSVILARVTPATAVIPTPTRATCLFEDADKNRPLIYWPFISAPGLGPLAAVVALFADWHMEHANGDRSNSWTAATWAYANSTVLPGLAEFGSFGDPEIAMPRFRAQTRAWFVPRWFATHESEEEELPSGYYQDEDTPEGYLSVGPHLVMVTADNPGFPVRIDLREVADQQGIHGIDWGLFQARSLCISVDGEPILAWSSENSELGEFTRAFVFYASGFVGFARKAIFPTIRARDLMSDLILCGDQVCYAAISGGTEYLACCQLSGDEINPEHVELSGASVGLIGRVWPIETQGLQPATTWANESHVFVQDGSGGLYAVDPAERELAWAYSGSRAIRPVGLVAGKGLLCQWELDHLITLQDNLYGPEWDAPSTLHPRTDLAPGLSLRGGLCYLSPATGDLLLAVDLEATEPNTPLLDAVVEYRTDSQSSVFTGPSPVSGDPLASYRWLTGWGGFRSFVAQDFVTPGWEPTGYKPGADEYPYDKPNEDGEGGPGEFLTANALYQALASQWSPDGQTQEIYSENTGVERDWRDSFFATYNAWREVEVRRLWSVLSGRQHSNDWLRIEIRENRFPLTAVVGGSLVDLGTGLGRGATTQTTPPTGSTLTVREQRDLETFDGVLDTNGDPRDHSDYTPAQNWQVAPGPKQFSRRWQYVWRPEPVYLDRARTSAPPHAPGPAAIGLGLIVFPPQEHEAEPRWVAYLQTTLTQVWQFSPAVDGDLFVGNVWIDGANVHVAWQDANGSYVAILNPQTGLPREEAPELPGDMIRQVFDGQNVHDYYGRWSLVP